MISSDFSSSKLPVQKSATQYLIFEIDLSNELSDTKIITDIIIVHLNIGWEAQSIRYLSNEEFVEMCEIDTCDLYTEC